jgi:glycosyltransferase involved in cell wall biosynthesis
MQICSEGILGVVVPLTRLTGKFKPIKSWIEEALDLKIQVVFVHDVNDETTGAELSELVKNLDSDLVSVIAGKNLGPGGARNLGLKQLQSKWVAFWDADDYPDPRAVMQMVIQAERKGLKASVGGYCTQNQKTNEVNENLLPWLDFQIAMNPGIWRWAFNRAYIEDSPFPHLWMAEDQVFIAKFLNQHPNFYKFNFIVYTYMTGDPDQLTSSKKNLNDLLLALDSLPNKSDAKSLQKMLFTSIMRIRIVGTVVKNRMAFEKSKGIKAIFVQVKFLVSDFVSNFKFPSKPPSPQDQIRLTLRGGFGNQIFQIAAAMSLNRQIGLQININEIAPTGKTQDLSLFNYLWPTHIEFQNTKRPWLKKKAENLGLRLTHANLKLKKIQFEKINSLLLNFLLRKLILGSSVVLQENPGFFAVKLRSNGPIQLIGYFQSYRFVSPSVKEWMKSELKPYRSRNLSGLESELEGKKLLVCHIRLGDYLSESRFGIVSPSKYADIVAQAWETGEYESIAVFSNQPEKVASFLPEGLECAIKVISESKVDLVAEFELMRKGAGYVLSNSTFGWWAAFLSTTENPPVIVPKPWFLELDDPVDLNPDSWTKADYIIKAKEFSTEILKGKKHE